MPNRNFLHLRMVNAKASAERRPAEANFIEMKAYLGGPFGDDRLAKALFAKTDWVSNPNRDPVRGYGCRLQRGHGR
jgi:hypothetical protein